MSFLGGAECSTAGNPLSQFTKHVQDDKSLQRDRLVGRGPAGGMQGMRSTGGMSGTQDNVSSAILLGLMNWVQDFISIEPCLACANVL
jgi:peroxin-5